MPEFSINENGHSSGMEYKIRPNTKRTGLCTEAHDLTSPPARDSTRPKDADHRQLGLPITR